MNKWTRHGNLWPADEMQALGVWEFKCDCCGQFFFAIGDDYCRCVGCLSCCLPKGATEWVRSPDCPLKKKDKAGFPGS